jgi:RNA polymerase-binding transcription factor
MTAKERKHFERRLLEERAKVVETLGEMSTELSAGPDEDGDISNFPLHLADEGTDTMDQEKEFLLASNEGRLLVRIDDALRTLYKDPESYGKCGVCGREISHERLELIPWATLCIEDERRTEAR